MKIKTLLVFFMAMAFAVTSCNKESGVNPGEENEETSLWLKFDFEGMTRSDAGLVTDQTPLVFKEGGLFFAKADGTVTRYVRITETFATGTVTPGQLESGYLFSGINNQTTRVHIVGNYDCSEGGTKTSYGNISELNKVLSLRDQTDNTFGISKATLYGAADLEVVVPGSGTPGDIAGADRETQVDVRPLISRLEIVKLTGDATIESDDSDAFVLEAIYIDNFWYKSTLTGTYSQYEDIIYSVGSSYKKYSSQAPDGVYTDPDWNPILFDDGTFDYPTLTAGGTPSAIGTAVSNVIAPANGGWVYNFYADASKKPHIILHLTNVKVEDQNSPGVYNLFNNTVTGTPGECYLTVNGYNDRNNNGAAVSIEGGYIYRIVNLLFGSNDLRQEPEGPGPNGEDFDVWVEVKLMKWTVIEVDVEFQ